MASIWYKKQKKKFQEEVPFLARRVCAYYIVSLLRRVHVFALPSRFDSYLTPNSQHESLRVLENGLKMHHLR